MHEIDDVQKAIAGLSVGSTTSAAAAGMATLQVLHKEITNRLPREERQEIRVIIATLEPGDRTPYHSHRFPVTVYMLGGEFTLELDDSAPIVLRAGDVFVEPAQVQMTGRNRGDQRATMVLFYVSSPDTPFADAVRP